MVENIEETIIGRAEEMKKNATDLGEELDQIGKGLNQFKRMRRRHNIIFYSVAIPALVLNTLALIGSSLNVYHKYFQKSYHPPSITQRVDQNDPNLSQPYNQETPY